MLANFGTDTASSEQVFPLFWKAVRLLEYQCGLDGTNCEGVVDVTLSIEKSYPVQNSAN